MPKSKRSEDAVSMCIDAKPVEVNDHAKPKNKKHSNNSEIAVPTCIDPKVDDIAKPTKKRSKNSFMFYCDENRQRVMETAMTNKVAEVAKLLGEEWRNLDEVAKEPFTQKAQAAKEALAMAVA